MKVSLSTVAAFKNVNGDENNVKLTGDRLIRYQQYLLKIAEDIITCCEKHNITYHLTGGSALGAVRHQGFIPWDDDMDIDILGSDFDKFVEEFTGEYGDRYYVQYIETPGYAMTVNRVRMRNTVFRAREDVGKSDCGFFVDVLRIENTYNNLILRKLHGLLCMGMGFLLSCRNFYDNREFMRQIAANNPQLVKVFGGKIAIGRLLSFATVNRWTKMTQAVYGMCKDNNSKYVSVPAGRKHFFGELYLRDDFVRTSDVMFCGHSWKVPYAYDEYLKHMYGDYMRIPDEADREEHIILELKFPEDIE